MTDIATIRDPTGLIRCFESRYHGRHRKRLLPLAETAEEVESVNPDEEGDAGRKQEREVSGWP